MKKTSKTEKAFIITSFLYLVCRCACYIYAKEIMLAVENGVFALLALSLYYSNGRLDKGVEGFSALQKRLTYYYNLTKELREYIFSVSKKTKEETFTDIKYIELKVKKEVNKDK